MYSWACDFKLNENIFLKVLSISYKNDFIWAEVCHFINTREQVTTL